MRDGGELAEWAKCLRRLATARRARRWRRGRRRAATSCSISISRARARFATSIPHDAVTIFVLPPSFAELEGRLRKRGTENEAAIRAPPQTRARGNAQAYPDTTYLIINADIERVRSARWKRSSTPSGSRVGTAARGLRAVEELAPAASEPAELDAPARAGAMPTIPQADLELIRRAYDYSARMHARAEARVGRALRHPSAERRADHRASSSSTCRRSSPACCTTWSRTRRPRSTRCASSSAAKSPPWSTASPRSRRSRSPAAPRSRPRTSAR